MSPGTDDSNQSGHRKFPAVREILVRMINGMDASFNEEAATDSAASARQKEIAGKKMLKKEI